METVRVPALGVRRLTPLYDPLLRWLGEERFKRELVAQAAVGAGERVLDLGCGTATLAILMKRAAPAASIVGLDGDPEVLARARRKVAEAGVDVELALGRVDAPPFEACSFDRIVSSLVLHHLTTTEKRRTLAAARVLLREGGELHILDWTAPANLLMRAAFLGVRLLDGFETTADAAAGRVPSLLREAGFTAVEQMRRWDTMFGTLGFWRASRSRGMDARGRLW